MDHLPKVNSKDIIEVIAKNTPNTLNESVGDTTAKAIKIVLENVSDVGEIQLIAEDMLESPWETLQEEGRKGEINRVLAQVSSELKKLKLKPIVECAEADKDSIEVILPHATRRNLRMRKTHNFRHISSVVDLIKEMEERSRYAE